MASPRLRAWPALVLFLAALAVAGCGDDTDQASGDAHKSAHTHQAATDSGSDRHLVSGLPDFTELVRQVSPAVINVSALPTKKDNRSSHAQAPWGDDSLRDWLRRFFGEGPEHPNVPQLPYGEDHVSLGSGFIISPDGYILTSRHVIADAGRIVVKLNDHRQLLAKVVGADPDSDVAVLKIGADELPTVRIGDPGKLDVGAWVVAIGSPFGFETSVTAGIVSAKRRSLANDQYVPFLQTDVAINPGNSGGPLFNLAGQVVGINAQIYSQTGGYQGLSFAIPIDIAMRIAQQLRATGHVTRGWLGVQTQDVDRPLAKTFELSRPQGALVTRVFAGTPAAQAGLRVGDVILAFNGHAVDSAADLPPLVGALAPGTRTQLKLLRDGEKQTLEVQVGHLPARYQKGGEGGADSGRENQSRLQVYGLSVTPLTAKQRQDLDIEQGGVRVSGVEPGPAADAGLQRGDVILSVGSVAIKDRQALADALQEADGPVALLVLRDGVRRYLPIRAGPQPENNG